MLGDSSEDRCSTRSATVRVVNEVAQGLRTLEEGTAWFSLLPQAERKAVLQEVMRLRDAGAHHGRGRERGSGSVRREAHRQRLCDDLHGSSSLWVCRSPC